MSETENIRKNLSIERMIVEGCDILLDVNQTFVRQGSSPFHLCGAFTQTLVTSVAVVCVMETSSGMLNNRRGGGIVCRSVEMVAE